jgi:hypothetical protein
LLTRLPYSYLDYHYQQTQILFLANRYELQNFSFAKPLPFNRS